MEVAEILRIVLKLHPGTYNFTPFFSCVLIPDENPMGEPVQQLRPEISFFRIHRTDQDEPGLHFP